jgi:GT2 family glycosyltransferase
MRLSYVIITHDRRDTLLRTLARLEATTPLEQWEWETIVVDNASDDGTAAAVAADFPAVRLVRLHHNEGMPARNHGFRAARGQYVCTLDDDSYPLGDAVPVALEYLDRNELVAAVVGRVELPDGTTEGPALPHVLLGGASVIRRKVLDATGGFAPEFFRQAEEYDLSFRILATGCRIERFEDVVFFHEKAPGGRISALTHRMDLRNNLILVERFLPDSMRPHYRHDWLRRYAALARHDGQLDAARQGLREAHVWARREREGGRQTVDGDVVEQVFGTRAKPQAAVEWKRRNKVARVAIADYGKDVYGAYAACGFARLQPVALIDPRAAFQNSHYRGLPVLPPSALPSLNVDGVVVSNVNPAQVGPCVAGVMNVYGGPILTFWQPTYLNADTAALAA